MEKKKRSKCETSHRKVFTVNEANPKEKVIFDFLLTVYNESDTIKDILYEYITSNNLQTAQHSINILPTLGKNSASNSIVACNAMVNNSTNECKENIDNNSTYNNVEKNRITRGDFSINIDNIEDEKIKVEHDQEEEIREANNNALDFLNNGF